MFICELRKKYSCSYLLNTWTFYKHEKDFEHLVLRQVDYYGFLVIRYIFLIIIFVSALGLTWLLFKIISSR